MKRILLAAIGLLFAGATWAQTVTPSLPTLPALGLPGPTQSLIIGGNSALRSGLPYQYPDIASIGLSASLSNTAPSVGNTTNILPYSAGALNTAAFTFSNGLSSWINPTGSNATIICSPNTLCGYGSSFVDFLSDAPVITFKHPANQGGAMIVFVDGNELFRVTPGIGTSTAVSSTATSLQLSTATIPSSGTATSTATNAFVGNWIYSYPQGNNNSGGQWNQVTLYGGAGLSYIATVSSAWVSAPGGGSNYDISDTRALYTDKTQPGYSNYFITQTWSTGPGGGERRMRHYRVETNSAYFEGVYVAPTDTVAAFPKPTGAIDISIGDSGQSGTGIDVGRLGCFARVIDDQLGRESRNLGLSGTGFLNVNNSGGIKALTFGDRLVPPINSWHLSFNGASSGKLSVTQSGQTVTFNYNDTDAAIQNDIAAGFTVAGTLTLASDVNSSVNGTLTVAPPANLFPGTATVVTMPLSASTLLSSSTYFVTLVQGSTSVIFNPALTVAAVTPITLPAFESIYSTANGQYDVWLVGKGPNATSSATMTLANTVGGATPTITQYLGDLLPVMPTDANGNYLPAFLTLFGSQNDSADKNANFTQAALTSEVERVINAINNKTTGYTSGFTLPGGQPALQMILTGPWYLPIALVDANLRNVDAAMLAAAQTLPPIPGTGKTPFVEFVQTYSGVAYAGGQYPVTGSGFETALTGPNTTSGTGNSDHLTFTDGFHPTSYAHPMIGNFGAKAEMDLFGLK